MILGPREQLGQIAFGFADGTLKRCNQCWKVKPLAEFISAKTGKVTQDCADCRVGGRDGVADHRTRLRVTANEHRVTFARKSGNRKTGNIPVSLTSPETCPPSCRFYNSGCYGESHILRTLWRQVERKGIGWSEFCARVAKLEPGQLWRHNEVGDMPGVGEAFDAELFGELVEANVGRRGFAYTHKLSDVCLPYYEQALSRGFVVNLSVDLLEDADRPEFSSFPKVVVVEYDEPRTLLTPGGLRVVVCPASYSKTTCAKCRLCARRRSAVIAFPAHGIREKLVRSIVRRDRDTLPWRTDSEP